jgi:hypothetical protein
VADGSTYISFNNSIPHTLVNHTKISTFVLHFHTSSLDLILVMISGEHPLSESEFWYGWKFFTALYTCNIFCDIYSAGGSMQCILLYGVTGEICDCGVSLTKVVWAGSMVRWFESSKYFAGTDHKIMHTTFILNKAVGIFISKTGE